MRLSPFKLNSLSFRLALSAAVLSLIVLVTAGVLLGSPEADKFEPPHHLGTTSAKG